MSSKSKALKEFEDPNSVFVMYSHDDAEIVLPNLDIFKRLEVNIDPNECYSNPIHSFESFQLKVRDSSVFIPFFDSKFN